MVKCRFYENLSFLVGKPPILENFEKKKSWNIFICRIRQVCLHYNQIGLGEHFVILKYVWIVGRFIFWPKVNEKSTFGVTLTLSALDFATKLFALMSTKFLYVTIFPLVLCARLDIMSWWWWRIWILLNNEESYFDNISSAYLQISFAWWFFPIDFWTNTSRHGAERVKSNVGKFMAGVVIS